MLTLQITPELGIFFFVILELVSEICNGSCNLTIGLVSLLSWGPAMKCTTFEDRNMSKKKSTVCTDEVIIP